MIWTSPLLEGYSKWSDEIGAPAVPCPRRGRTSAACPYQAVEKPAWEVRSCCIQKCPILAKSHGRLERIQKCPTIFYSLIGTISNGLQWPPSTRAPFSPARGIPFARVRLGFNLKTTSNSFHNTFQVEPYPFRPHSNINKCQPRRCRFGMVDSWVSSDPAVVADGPRRRVSQSLTTDCGHGSSLCYRRQSRAASGIPAASR